MGVRNIAGIPECSSAMKRAIWARPRTAPTGTSRPNSRQNPRSMLILEVRPAIQAERVRCSACSASCSTDFTATGLMSLARTASSSAAASAASVLFLFT